MSIPSALAILAALSAQDGRRWSYFDSRETDTGPRLELELADGTTRELAADADAILLEYLPEASYPAHPRLSVDMGDRNRVLLRWELEPGLQVVSARARLDAHPSERLAPREPFELAFHAVLEPWKEESASWSSQPAFEDEPCASLVLPPAGGEVEVDLTAIVQAWTRGDRADHGLLVHAAAPVALPPSVPQPASPAGASLDGQLLELYPWEESLSSALARAREEDRQVLVLVAAAFGREPITEHERLLLATVLCHPDVRAAIDERFVPVRVRVSPAIVALAFESGADDSNPLAALGLELTEAKPPALVVASSAGDVRGELKGFAVCDPREVLQLLGVPPRTLQPAEKRHAMESLYAGELGEARTALASLEQDAEARYWAAAAADALGDRAAGAQALEDLEARFADSPWAFKARVRRAYPDLVGGYESVWSRKPPGGERGLVEQALDYLCARQLPDGSFPMGYPVYEEHREGITVLCSLALLVHDRRDASERARQWVAERLEGRAPGDVNSFTATYWLDLALERVRRGAPREEVADAIELLVGGQMENGAWSYSKQFGENWHGGFAGWPETELGRAHSMNTGIALEVLTRARAAGFEVAPAVLERGRDALLAMRSTPAAYTYTWPEPVNFSTVDASIGRACAAELALLRLEAALQADLETALDEFVARRATLHPPAQLSDSWLPPHGLSGYFHSFAYYHAARALAEVPEEPARRARAALRADVLARVEDDGTWMDTIGLGKPYATAMALLVLWLVGN